MQKRLLKQHKELPVPSERAEHQAVALWLDARRLLWNHCPNEAKRSPQTAALLKTLGLKAGVPDIMIYTRPPKHPDVRGVAVEMKRRNRNKSTLSAMQRGWLAELQAQGWLVHIAYGAQDAMIWLASLGF